MTTSVKTEQVDFKSTHRATLADARRVHRRIRSLVRPLGYAVSLHGSTVIKGRGRDIDLHVVGLGDDAETQSPDEVALLLVIKMARVIRLYEQIDVDSVSDVYLNFVTRDGLYLDVHVKGMV